MDHRRATIAGSRVEGSKHFRLCLSFTRVSNGKPEDGLRFSFPETIKFGIDEPYQVFLTFEPAVRIVTMSVHNDLIDFRRLGTKVDPNLATYCGVWEPRGFPVTSCHHREQLKFVVGLDDGAVFITSLQCKFYAKEETSHCAWGETMHAIHFQCVTLPDKSVVIVKQELM
ncbi:uncharacterized protein LOC129589744 [Paramacrobiotus metropolitanus]|uniref:uncharacterized protein LOC129589744 n=1 Tax=Paramacrobiotus metropolitanus TaxID=2943436 RepID=UPI0024456F51|nr:uncharacterized protein LOC129589744 [Paramacrobiotus metropolitanus]